MENTLIVFTSDHGDYFGDHFLGEKDFFHDCSAKVPLIIYDPSEEADATRGTVETRPVELVDLIPTFIDVATSKPVDTDSGSYIRLDGRSLLPLLHNQDVKWKDYAVCEVDFGDRRGPRNMGLSTHECWAVMLADEQYKYIAFHNMRPMLFDLVNDPNELNDLGEHPDFAEVRNDYKDKLLSWFISGRWRTTMDDADLARVGLGVNREKKGVLIGYWDEADLPEEVQVYRKNGKNR